jgi:hypothetical protein
MPHMMLLVGLRPASGYILTIIRRHSVVVGFSTVLGWQVERNHYMHHYHKVVVILELQSL